MHMDEIAIEKHNYVQTKILVPTTNEAFTKRAAFGDLQNCEVLHVQGAKNVVQKVKMKDVKLQNAFRNTKARVDTHWKMTPLTGADNLGVTKKIITTTGKSIVDKTQTITVAKKDNLTEIKILMPVQKAVESINFFRCFEAIEDINADDKQILVLVAEYVNDIYDYLYSVEEAQFIRKDHLNGQLEVHANMRSMLIDWLNQVHLQFRFTAETFYMSVGIIDLYLQTVKDTKRLQLQLVGVTALFIATKYEQLIPLEISKFAYITNDAFTARQIRLMEMQILKALDFKLSRPLPIHFLRRYSKAAGAKEAHHAMSKYFLELSSIEYDLASYKPSEIAAASLFLSLHLLSGKAMAGTGFNDNHWTKTLEFYSRYTAQQLRPITKKIAPVARNAPHAKLKAVYKKYKLKQFQKVALRSELYGLLMGAIVNSSL